jgi:hypothetical protein
MNLDVRVEKLLEEAIELADIGGITVTARSIAESLYDSQPELMAELHRPWVVDRLIWIIGRKRRSQWRRNPRPEGQLVLPGFEGLPQTIFLRNGSRKLLDEAMATHVREHIKMLRARLKDSPKIKRMEAVLELMETYSAEEPRIKWAEVKKRELERLETDGR